MINTIIEAFLLGLVGGAIPGPVLTAIFTEILQNGFLKSLRIIFQAMLTESLVALICLVGFSAVNFPANIFNLLSIVGAFILFWIAFSIWKIKKFDTETKVHFSFWKISGMILANGVLWTFWITVIVPKAIQLKEQISFGQFLYMFCVEIGWLVSTIAIAFIFSRFKGILSKPKIIAIIFKIFALTFIYFGIEMIYKTIVFFSMQH